MTGEEALKEAAMAWSMCADIHRKYAKDKDHRFDVLQDIFNTRADEARMGTVDRTADHLLRALAEAIDGARISEYQSTAAWKPQLDAALQYLKNGEHKESAQSDKLNEAKRSEEKKLNDAVRAACYDLEKIIARASTLSLLCPESYPDFIMSSCIDDDEVATRVAREFARVGYTNVDLIYNTFAGKWQVKVWPKAYKTEVLAVVVPPK